LAVAYSPDGRTLAYGAFDYTVRLCELASGRELHTLSGHKSDVFDVAYSPNGRTLASASADQTVKIWDADTGTELRALLGHDDWVWSLEFSPGGRRIASVSKDQTIRLWDATTGQELLRFPGPAESKIFNLGFSPDGLTLACGSGDDRTVRLWEAGASTPEEQASREALGVVEFLFAQSLSADQVRDRIRNDPTLDADVRQRALDLAGPYEQSLVVHEAERALLLRFGAGMFRPEAVASLRGDPALSETVRRCALELAGHLPEVPYGLNEVSWSVVSRPDADAAAYRRALQQAEHACRLVPEDGEFLTTLGAAQYRLGYDGEAVATLVLADDILTRNGSDSRVERLALLALTQHRLGKVAEARAALDRLRMVVTQPQWNVSQPGLALLHEINALEQDLAFPVDAFAP
jgi:hypothetical protein